jgi:hypothetical protein
MELYLHLHYTHQSIFSWNHLYQKSLFSTPNSHGAFFIRFNGNLNHVTVHDCILGLRIRKRVLYEAGLCKSQLYLRWHLSKAVMEQLLWLYDIHATCDSVYAGHMLQADNLLSNFVTLVAYGPLKREQGSLPLWWWQDLMKSTTHGRREEVKRMSNKERKATDIVLYFCTSQGFKWGEVGNTGLKRKYRGKGNF